jgi:hypothetical protein
LREQQEQKERQEREEKERQEQQKQQKMNERKQKRKEKLEKKKMKKELERHIHVKKELLFLKKTTAANDIKDEHVLERRGFFIAREEVGTGSYSKLFRAKYTK